MSFTSSVSAFILSFVDLIAFDIVGLVYVYVYVHLCGREREREAPRRYTTNGNNSLLLVNDEHYYYGDLFGVRFRFFNLYYCPISFCLLGCLLFVTNCYIYIYIYISHKKSCRVVFSSVIPVFILYHPPSFLFLLFWLPYYSILLTTGYDCGG